MLSRVDIRSDHRIKYIDKHTELVQANELCNFLLPLVVHSIENECLCLQFSYNIIIIISFGFKKILWSKQKNERVAIHLLARCFASSPQLIIIIYCWVINKLCYPLPVIQANRRENVKTAC